jgi:FkbM family methyltransferase
MIGLMRTNTKVLYASLARRIPCDLILDIGSRDGQQSLLFRRILPEATVVAFEANPQNISNMREREDILAEANIRLIDKAVSDVSGTVPFHIVDIHSSEAAARGGMSSLIEREDVPIFETVQVDAIRLDDFLSQPPYAACRDIALWIDVEGAEYRVLESAAGQMDRIRIVHVETAIKPLHKGQRSLKDLTALMDSYSFAPIGHNIPLRIGWGDMVFMHNDLRVRMATPLRKARRKAYASHLTGVNAIAAYLKKRHPRLYTTLRGVFVNRL